MVSTCAFNAGVPEQARSCKLWGIEGTDLQDDKESLEQLRALEHGIKLAVATVNYESIGVDTPEDAARVEAWLSQG